jgi:hypothetical protein
MAARRVFRAIVLAFALLTTSAQASAQSSPPIAPNAGSYAELAAYQRQLFDEVLQRYNAIARTRHAPAAAYDAMPPSRRTTFEAVTHALGTTALTDENGAALGSGIDIVKAVDEIAGESRGARGDRQFRLYVLLEPDAVERLTRSREFRQGADNTIYHPGYPMSFRLRGGTPSIQVSISRDGLRGDIDVDYRSSAFPIGLFNGHLTSANSDVRAGDNYDRHQQRWTGLGNWWQRFLGLFSAPVLVATDAPSPGVIPVQPRLPSGARIEAAVEDFLQAWLVEGRPESSAAYFSPLSFACVRPPDHAPAGEGLERYVVLQRMKAAKDAIGTVRSLAQASLSVNPWDRRLRVQPHRAGAAFLLARVPQDLAAAYDCANRTGAEPSLVQGEYFASAFRLRVPGGPAPVLVLLWTREPGGFRIVAMGVEEAGEPTLPIRGTSRPASASALRARRVSGPAPLVEAATAFHRAWLLDRNTDRALTYIDEASFGCLLAESDSALGANRESMRRMLEAVGARVASTSTLTAAIRTVEPAEPGANVVDHPEQRAFTIVPVGSAFAERAVCGSELPAPSPNRTAGEAEGLGRAFVSYFQLNLPGDPAFLLMLWTQRGSDWRIPYWTVVAP